MLRQPFLVYWFPENPVFYSPPCPHPTPPFLYTVSQTTFGYLLLTVQHLCDLQDAIPHHWPPNPYLGKQTISLGVAIILSMYLRPHT